MKIFVVALLGLAIALSTVPATAQDTKPAATDAKPKVGQRIGDWFFQCQALSANENISGLMQNFFDNRTKRQIVGVAVRYAGKGKDQRLGMFVTVPLGIFLGSGIGGKIDGEKQFKFNLQSCKAAKLQSCKAAASAAVRPASRSRASSWRRSKRQTADHRLQGPCQRENYRRSGLVDRVLRRAEGDFGETGGFG
jgi:invasion protein IalB